MARITPQEYFKMTWKVIPKTNTSFWNFPQRNKMGNVKVNWYDSKLENNRAQQLKIEEKLWIIKDLEEQKVFILQEWFSIESEKTKNWYEKIQAITYKADFVYQRIWEKLPTVEDSKGFKTEVYKIKKKMFLKKYWNEYNFLESIDKWGNTK